MSQFEPSQQGYAPPSYPSPPPGPAHPGHADPAYADPARAYGPGQEPPLWLPHYGIGPVGAVTRFLRKYADFSGRASRSEYWWVALVVNVVYLALALAALALGLATSPDGGANPGAGAILPALLLVALFLGTVVPTIALTVRRLHDADFSGWLYLLVLIPYLGSLVLVIFAIVPGKPQGMRFDRPPPEGYRSV